MEHVVRQVQRVVRDQTWGLEGYRTPDLPPLYIETDAQDAPDVEVSVFEQRFPELAAMGVTLKVRKIKATSGELSQSQLELHPRAGRAERGWDGYEYVLKLPSGEEVMVAAPSKTVVSDGRTMPRRGRRCPADIPRWRLGRAWCGSRAIRGSRRHRRGRRSSRC